MLNKTSYVRCCALGSDDKSRTSKTAAVIVADFRNERRDMGAERADARLITNISDREYR